MDRRRYLPLGVYAVSEEYREQEGEVVVEFRGERYTATVGVSAFGQLNQAIAAAEQIPAESFCGVNYDTPVILVPAGVYRALTGRPYINILIERPITILGEAVGISPNHPEDMCKVNPARPVKESILQGRLYFGNLVIVDGTPGVVTLDGLTLDGFRISDRRTSGSGIGVTVKNCMIDGAHHANIVNAAELADSQSSRAVLVRDCRVDGFDSMEGRGCFINACATELLVERVYYANTKEFFGLTGYGREEINAPSGAPATLTVRQCVLSKCGGARGMSFALPEQAENVEIRVENCTFCDATPDNVPVIYAQLPNKTCSLTVKDTGIVCSGKMETAVLIDGVKDAPVKLEGVTLNGTGELYGYKPPRRTQAPAKIGEVVWSGERLEDPHEACTDEGAVEEALRQLKALYAGRTAMHGDMHTHTNSGGTSDGKTPLAEFVRQLKELGLDFAAVVDHKQIRHCLLPEWDDMLICGTEPAAKILDDERKPKESGLHYCMLFQQPSDFFRVMEAFPEYQFAGGPDGHFVYAKFTPERFAELGRFIYSLGGLMVHAHPKQVMVSETPEHYYFGENVPLESILGDANSYDTIQNRDLWVSLLKQGKRMHTHGDSDTHAQAKNGALTTVYARERKGAAVLREVREGDCAAGAIGIKMAINGARMGGSLPYREGLNLAIQLDDYYKPTMLDDTVYCLKVYTERGLAYASEFSGQHPQRLVIPVKERKYYRVEVTNESDGFYVGISNPIWLD